MALYALVGGHLPHLVPNEVQAYCLGNTALVDVESVLVADIVDLIVTIDDAQGSRTACAGLCGVIMKRSANREILKMLVEAHLVVAPLRMRAHVDSPLVRAYVRAHCSCNE